VRIGFDATILTRPLTGVGVYTARLVEALARTARFDEVFIFAHKPLFGLSDELPVNIVSRRSPNAHIFVQFILPRLLKEYDIDVLHGPNFYLPLISKTPSVVTVHDLSAQLFPEQHSHKHRLSQKLLRPSLKKADRIIAVSEATARDIEGFWSGVKNKVKIVYNGIDSDFKPASDDKISKIRKQYRLPEKFVLFVGTLEPRKNVARLVEAYSDARDNLDGAKLVIAGGKGWLFDEIFTKVEKLGISDEVLFTGYIPREDLPALYSAAEVFCYPSLYEGFGFPPLEAAACGTPVLTSNRSSIPEIMNDAALLVNPESIEEISRGLVRLFRDDGLRKDLIERGQERASMFNWKKTALKTLAIYKNLL